jgi:hypothetical protein
MHQLSDSILAKPNIADVRALVREDGSSLLDAIGGGSSGKRARS